MPTAKVICMGRMVVVAVLLFGLLPRPGVAEAARLDAPPFPIAGHTVIRAEESGAIDVVIPEGTRISKEFWFNEDFRASGNGRVVGVVLVKQSGPRTEAFNIAFTRWSFCDEPACEPKRSIEMVIPANWERSYESKREWLLPSGRYRLYVVTDGAPVEIELWFGSVGGETLLHPHLPATVGVRQPTLLLPDDQKNLVVATDSFEMTSPGLMVEGSSETPQLGAGANAQCFIRSGGDPLEGDPLQRTACGAGGGYDTSQEFDVTWGFFASRMVEAGEWDSAFTYAFAGATKGIEFLDLWVSFD